MKKIIAILLTSAFAFQTFAAENFSDSEANFKLVMQKLLEKYIDKNLSKDELYKAATAGMLSSLNKSEETWNKLMSPDDMKELELDLAGKVTGIGAEMKFTEQTGYATITKIVPNSPAEKSGIKKDDQILSVDGKKFKGKPFKDLVYSIRGQVGKKVGLKILRDDRIISLDIKREIIPWTPVEFQKVDNNTGLLAIGYFTEDSPKLVETSLREVNEQNIKKLIVDLRGNSGGGFDQAIKVTELFLPKGKVITTTKNREGKIETFKSNGGLLNNDVQVILLTNKETFCGAELLAAALKENKSVKIVGETTFGKWNAQTVESLPNKFAIKYTVKEFRSPLGNSFQDTGLKPDVEVILPKDVDSRELSSRFDVSKRLELDAQLKAAFELVKTI